MNGEVDPAKLEKRSGVCFGGMKPFGGKIPRLQRSAGRGGFIKNLNSVRMTENLAETDEK